MQYRFTVNLCYGRIWRHCTFVICTIKELFNTGPVSSTVTYKRRQAAPATASVWDKQAAFVKAREGCLLVPNTSCCRGCLSPFIRHCATHGACIELFFIVQIMGEQTALPQHIVMKPNDWHRILSLDMLITYRLLMHNLRHLVARKSFDGGQCMRLSRRWVIVLVWRHCVEYPSSTRWRCCHHTRTTCSTHAHTPRPGHFYASAAFFFRVITSCTSSTRKKFALT